MRNELQEENASLRIQLSKLQEVVESDTHRQQNGKLRMQLKNLQARHKNLSEEASTYGRPQTAAGRNKEMVDTQELLDEMQDYDSELADLVRKNVDMLSQIKEDLRETQHAFGESE